MAELRKPIPDAVVVELLIATRRRCCLCSYLANDWSQKRVQIAHIDRKRNNDASENLAPLCLDHHDQYDSRTSQSKGITEGELRAYMKMLVEHYASTPNPAPDKILVEDRELPSLASEIFLSYGRLLLAVSAVLHELDPICGLNSAPADEYDLEAHDIIARLQDNRACLSTEEICRQVLTRWFSETLADQFTKYNELAHRIDILWDAFKARNVVFSSKDL